MSNETYDPEWGWDHRTAFHAALRSQLEYGEDEDAIGDLHPQTERVHLHRDSEVQHSVTTLPDAHVVCFRGSDASLEDWLGENAKIRRIKLSETAPGRGHRGFFGAVDSVYDEIVELVDDGRPVFSIGHSKGGADATAFAFRAMDSGDVFIAAGATFGSPRVLGRRAAEWFERRIGKRWWRVVNNCDIVTRLPFSSPFRALGGYKHVGRVAYLEHDGDLTLDPGRWQVFKDRVRGRWEALKGDEPSVAEVPGILDEQADRLVAAGLEKLSDIAAASLTELAAAVGMGPAGLVVTWATTRLAGVDLSALDGGAAVFDGTRDHFPGEYSRILRNLAEGEQDLTMPGA